MQKIFILLFLFILTPSLLTAESVSNDLSSAIQAQKKGEYNAALIHFKNAVQKEPDNIDIKLAMAAYYIQVGIGTQAEIELDKAEFLGAKKKDIQLLRIKSQLIQGKFSEVTSQISEILNVDTKDIGRIRALQGQAYLNQGNVEKARSYFLRGSRLAPDALEVKIGMARLYSIDNKKNESKKIIESLYQEHPYSTDVLLLIGNLYREELKYKQAQEFFESAITIQPGNTAARIGLITSYIGDKKLKQADAAVEQLLAVDAEHETGNHLQAIIAYEMKDYTKALQAIKVVEKNNHNHKGILLVAGSVYYQQGKLDLAESRLKEFLEVKPDDLATKKMLSAVYLKRNQGSQVIHLLSPYENNGDISVLSLLSSAYKTIGNQKKSSDYLEKALKIAPENSKLLAQKQLNNVLINNTEALKLIDDNFQDFHNKGLPKVLQLLKNKQTADAIQLLKNYKQKEPDNYIFYNLTGQAYLQSGDLEQAKINYNKVIELKPDYFQARISLARIALQENNSKQAKREYQLVLTKDPDNETAMLDLAKLSLLEKNTKGMLSWLKKARRANKTAIAPRVALNKYYLATKDYNEALKISTELIEIQPENISILKLHADNLLQTENLSQTIRIYKQMVKLEPESPLVYYWLASAQYLWNDTENAKKNFIKVLELKPDHIISRNAVIKINLKSKKYVEALAQIEQLIELNPKASLSYETRGDILILLKKPLEAIKSYNTALSLQDKNYLLVNKIARAYAISGNIKKSAETYENWLKNYPKNTEIRLTLALLYQQNKQTELAKKHYEKIIALQPDNVSAINNLALIYVSTKDAKAFEYAEIAYSLAPENPNVLDTLGWLLLKNGEKQRALKLLKQGVEISPADFDLRYHYAAALYDNNYKKEAKQQLNMIVPVPGKFKARNDARKLLDSF